MINHKQQIILAVYIGIVIILVGGLASWFSGETGVNLGGSFNRFPIASSFTHASTTVSSTPTKQKVFGVGSSTGIYLRLENQVGDDTYCALSNASASVGIYGGIKLDNPTSTDGGQSSFEIYGYKGDVWCVGNGTSTISLVWQ